MIGLTDRNSNACPNFWDCRTCRDGEAKKVNGFCTDWCRYGTCDKKGKRKGAVDCTQCRGVALLQTAVNETLLNRLVDLGSDASTNVGPSESFEEAWFAVPAAEERAVATELVRRLPAAHANADAITFWKAHKYVLARWTLPYLEDLA